MGAIVAGMFAAGKLPELKAWFMDMTRRHMFELMDFTLTKNYLVKGEKLMSAIGNMIPDCQMEDLSIPLTLIATDMKKGEEYTVVLRPEAAALADEGGLPCEVVLSCFMGSYQNYHVMVGGTLVKLEEHNPKNKHIYQVGDTCSLVFEADSVHVL